MAMPPVIPDADPLDGSETVRVRQKGMIKKVAVALLKGLKGDAGLKGDQGVKGDVGTPKRIETYAATIAGSAGQAAITFAAFTTAPHVDPKNIIISGQLYVGTATNITTTGATLTYMRTKGTLLLTASAVEVAPAGTSVSAVVIGS